MIDSESEQSESETNRSSNLVERETQRVDEAGDDGEVEAGPSTDEAETKSVGDESEPTTELNAAVEEEGNENAGSSKSNDSSDSSDSSSNEPTNEKSESNRSRQNKTLDLNKEVDNKSDSNERSPSCESFDDIEKEFDEKMNTYSLVKNNAQTDVSFCV